MAGRSRGLGWAVTAALGVAAVASGAAAASSGGAAAAASPGGAAEAAGAAPGGGARQAIDFAFDQRAPGAPTALRLSIDYVNPADPGAKPYAVETLVEALAEGARIDTSVPELCTASDAELTATGAAACPAGSSVGGGELDLDTGVEGPGRIVRNKVTLLNNTDQLILLVEPEGGGRAVSRARVEGGTFYTGAPPLPGGPPDGFTAIKRVRVAIDRIAAGGRGYVTTPPRCPPQGAWVNSIEFTYRDGVTQTASTSNPCDALPADRLAPRIRIHGLPRGCAPRAFLARISVGDAPGIRSAKVRLDGRVVRTTRRRHFRVRVRAAALRPGRHRLAVTAVDRAGNRSRANARFRRCRGS